MSIPRSLAAIALAAAAGTANAAVCAAPAVSSSSSAAVSSSSSAAGSTPSGFTSPPLTAPDHESCPVDAPLSCSIGTSDTCCYEGTNGLFLQTQFWDYNPATGPDDVWTIHGLWSDKCAGGYQQFCNPSWEIQNATAILSDLGYDALLETMHTNWRDYNGGDESLWLHEFNKHGTCMSTVNPGCYDSSAKQYQYVGDFYSSVVKLWEELPSYKFLTAAGLTPSTETTYTVQQWQDILGPHVDGTKIYFGCDKQNAITELWYFFNLKGSVADGTFIPTDSITTSTCKDGFKWIPKGSGGGGGGDGDTPGTGSKGYLNIDGPTGCLISDGSWFVGGTCGTYTLTETIGGYSVKSSKGACGIVNNVFTCGSGVTASDFTLDGDHLSYGGSTQWSAPNNPASQQRVAVSPGSGSVNFKITFDTK